MLEEQLAFYLEKYLGTYVKGLSKEALNVSVWQGNVELKNMQLKPEALDALKLPIKIKAGFLGSVKLKVPWSRLGQEPVVVELDRIFILAAPAMNVEGGDFDSVQEAKSRRVREEEVRLVNSMVENSKKADEASNSSWLGSLIGTVIGNLKLSITNIHIRYEDEESNAGHPFAAGLTLAKLAAVTVDEDGKETFVTGGALDRVQKSGELNRLSFYFDSDTKPWPMEKSWQELEPQDYNKVFLPGIKEEPSNYEGEKPAWIENHFYVLEPVGGTARYFKLGQRDKRSPDTPVHKAIAVLDDVTISLTEKQYRDALKLVENISTFAKRLQYAHYRPTRSVMEDRKGWWHYVYTAVSEERKKASGYLSWRQILAYSKMRKQYVSKYIEALRTNSTATSVNDNMEIMELDRQLDSEIIIQWRMVAHAFVDQERKKGQEERQANSSWWSFVWGGDGGSDTGRRGLTEDDWKRYSVLVGFDEGKLPSIFPGENQPNMLHTQVEVQMRHNGTKLLSASGDSILELTSEGLGCGIKLYPETKTVNITLDSFKISTPEGLLGESAHEEKSLYGTFILSPWDKELDWSFEARAAPCYVTVWMESIHRITQFFSSKEAVSRDVAIQTAAALQSTVNEVSKNAQQQLNEALKNKPKFLLDLDIAAPKVTIPTDFYPDGQHQCKMFLDLGKFSIKTSPADGSAVDSTAENQLYMSFRVGLKDISAFLVDGDYDWRKKYDVNPITGRLQLGKYNLLQDEDTSIGSQAQGKAKSGDEGLFFLPMLEKTGIVVSLEQICVPHPKYPTTRVAVRLESLGFQFSPARYHRIMQVVEVFAGGSNQDDAHSAFRPWDIPDFDGQLSVLSWKIVKRKHVIDDPNVGYDIAKGEIDNSALHRIMGVGHREAEWEPRYGALAGPFLYLLESKSSDKYKTYHSLIGKKVFNVPEESLGGVENVLAICDAGQLENKVAEATGALLLRFEDEEARKNWQGRFAGAIYRTSSPAAVAGLLRGKDEKKEDVYESTQTAKIMLAEQESVFVIGVLDELKIIISNSIDVDHRSTKLLLAPENPLLELRAVGTKVEFVMRKNDMLVGAVLRTLEIEDKFHGHISYSCRYLARSYIKQESKVEEEQNLRIGRSKVRTTQPIPGSINTFWESPSKAELTPQSSSGDERFFDANYESGYDSSSSFSSLHRRDSSADAFLKFFDAQEGVNEHVEPPSFKREVGLLPGSTSSSQDVYDVNGGDELKSFVKAQVIMTLPESPTYASIDKEVRVSLSTLSFYCNRPTLIAVLDLLTAISAEVHPKKDAEAHLNAIGDREGAKKFSNTERKDDSGPSNVANKRRIGQEVDDKKGDKVYRQSISANADGVVSTIDPNAVEFVDDHGNAKIAPQKKDSVVKGLLGNGKERVVFLLVLDMELAEFVLNKEDGSQLATLSQDNLRTDMKIYPASWGIKAILGNLRISDDNVKDFHHAAIPYPYICDMRDSSGSSFIELEMESFNKDDLDYEGYDFSVTGKFSEVRIVFLNRFIQEILAYLMGLVPQNSEVMTKLRDRASNYEKLFSQSEIEGQPSLKLNISLLKPIIIMPRGTYSTDFMELDILHINIRSSSEWFGGGKDDLGAVRLETINLDIENVCLSVGLKGEIGSEIFDRAKGIGLVVRRPLRDLWHNVPGIEATVKIEELRASLADKEYQVITECVTQNMAERPDVFPTLFGNKALKGEKSKAEGEALKLGVEGAIRGGVATEGPESLNRQGSAGSGSSPENPYTTMKVVVGIDLVELRLFIGGTRDASLASVQVIGVWASYKETNIAESVIMASLERLSLKDEREGTDLDMQCMVGYADDNALDSLEVIPGHVRRNRNEEIEDDIAETSNTSDGWGYGLTMLVLDAKLSPTKQDLSLRIQRPRVVVAFDFLLAVGEFFVPSLHAVPAEKGEENALDMKKGVFLNNLVYKQTLKEIKISPKRPLVADYEGVQEYIYDGQGNTLRLLDRHGEDLSMPSSEVLIFVGDGKRLIFRNVVIQNGDYMDSALHLGSHSSYSASRDDGVFFEGPSEGSDSSSTGSSHFDERESNVTEGEKPSVEMIVDLQVIGPELTLYDSIHRPSDSLVLPERDLRAKMNVFARLSMKGADMDLTAKLNGFTVESTSGVKVFEPFDASATYSVVTGLKNIHIDMTDIYTNFSFSILQLILRLEDDVMSIMRITSEEITVECSEFEKIWADDDSRIAVGGSHLAFWRPRAPPGFAVLGDCVTPLDEPPAKGVLTVNMALARGKRPLGYKCVWSSTDLVRKVAQSSDVDEEVLQSAEVSIRKQSNDPRALSNSKKGEEQGCSVWLPTPPEGYVALGCVVWKGQEEPPHSAALCVLTSFLSPCSMRDCIDIQGHHGLTEASDQKQWAFWRVDNSVGTFFVQKNPTELIHPQPYDLRLSISKYGLCTVNGTVSSSGKAQARLPTIGEEEANSSEQLTAVISSGRIYQNVGRFKLVWWDKGSRSRHGFSIWRPNVPPGCAMLGDVAMKGYEPPSTGLVLRDTKEGGLMCEPERFQGLAHISKEKHLDGVYFWIPVAPPGYSVIGCIASKSSRPDKDAVESIRCVRNDLVSKANFSVSSLWTTMHLDRRQQQMSIWPVENEARSFFVKPGNFGSPSQSALGLAGLRRQKEPDNLTLAVEVKSASVTLYDDFGGFMAPLLDLSISGIQVGLHGRMEAFNTVVNFSLAATTYNSKFDLWEPLIETCDAVVRYEYTSDSDNKVRPTISRVRINIQSDFNINVSVANVNMLLEAYSSWMNLSNLEAISKKQKTADIGASRRALRVSIDKSMDGNSNKNSLILAHNEVGEQLWLRTFEGNGRYQVSALPPDGIATIKLPISHSNQDYSQTKMLPGRSRKLVAVRIGDAKFVQKQGVGGREYMAAIRIGPTNLATVSRQLQFQSARTRCVNCSQESGTDKVHVTWDEFFVFEVQSGEVYRAEIVVTDLARGMPVGSCSLKLADEESRGENSGPLIRSEILHPPKMIEGEAGLPDDYDEAHRENGQPGSINLAVQFVSLHGEEDHDEDLEDSESQLQSAENPQKFGAIEVSVTRNGPWSPVRLNYGLGPAPWHLGRDHLASEMLVHEGVKHLFIRTLVTVVNETDYSLKARLCPDFLVGQEPEKSKLDINDPSWFVEEEVFENERRQPQKGWGHPKLPTDPQHWSMRDLSGSSKEFPQFSVPNGWVWTSDWRVDRSGAVDQDGWAYAIDFFTLVDWPPASSGEEGTIFVRRRRWIRSRQRKDNNKNMVISLGTLEPHSTVACPIASLRPGGVEYVFQMIGFHHYLDHSPRGRYFCSFSGLYSSEVNFVFKPRVGSVDSGVAHAWSSVVSHKIKPELGKARQPSKELRIRGLHKTEELLRCSVLASSSVTNEKDAWLCVDSSAIEVGRTSQLDPIKDWRLTISAPLELVNFLPVSCKYTVSEKADGKNLVPVQSGSVEPGGSTSIFQCDLRKAIYLKWVPDGGWLPQQDDVLISQPGNDSAKGVIVTNLKRDLAIHMQYDNGSSDISAKVIQFYVPCWLDSTGCPSLKYKLLDHGRKNRKSDKGWERRKSMEEIDEEAMHSYPTMLSNYDCKTMELAVALSGSECIRCGPAASLDALGDANGFVDLRVTDDENLHYRFLVTTTSHPKGFAQTQVVRIRPFTLFTNRLGIPLEVKQAGGDQSKTLNPWDSRFTLPFQSVQESLQLQVRLKESEWSFPFLIDKEEIMDVVVRHSDGQRQSIRVDVHGHEYGSRFLSIFQLGSSRGPYRIENRMNRTKLTYRQVGLDENAWRIIKPHSSAIFAWENLQGDKLLEVIQEGRDVSQSVKIPLDKLSDRPMSTGNYSGFCVQILDASGAKVVRFFEPELEILDNGIGGENEIEQSVATQGAAPSVQDDQEKGAEVPSQMEIVLDVETFGLSIVDQQPRELIFLVMRKVDIVFASGLGENVSRYTLVVGHMQVDNQLPLTPMPVLLAPELHEGDFVIKVVASMKGDSNDAIRVYPYLGVKVTASAWRISVHEALLWAFLELYNNLHLDRLSSDSQAVQVVQVDPEIRIETLDISEVHLKLSVDTSPDQRPHGKLGIWGPAVTTLGNISKMPIKFRSVYRENRRMRSSQVQAQILNRVKRDLIHQPLQLLTGVDVLGMTSSTLGTMSRGAANLSKDDDFLRARTNQETSRNVKGMRDGVVQGTTTLARAVGYGFKGIVTKPMDGAEERGFIGCIQGCFKAMVGVVVEPLSGCLDFMAISVTGLGTSCTKCFEFFDRSKKVERYRLPRAIKGDGILTPYDPNAALGQAILHLAQSGGVIASKDMFRTVGIFAFSDFYQDHFHVPNHRIVMLTNRRILMLQCPPSHLREQNKELTDPSTVLWEVQWNNLLFTEANKQNEVLLHPRDSTNEFIQVISCHPSDNPETTQANEIYSAIYQQWRAFCPTPENPSKPKKLRRLRRRLKPRPVWEIGMGDSNSQASSSRSHVDESYVSGSSTLKWEVQQHAPTTPADDQFRLETSLGKLIWSYHYLNGSCLGSTDTDTISFWRPDPPPGYVSVGDVAYTGGCSDSQTVIAYRNDEDRFEMPLGFDLVWRNWKDGIGSPMSMWMPKAPDGYVALGCVVCADYEEPHVDTVWCVHIDLTEEAELQETAIWKAPSQAPWQCFVYPVVSEVKTFIAMREEKSEHAHKPRKVVA